MKTYAPKGLHGAMLRPLLDDLHATPAEVAKYLKVTERSVWRWLADDSAPFAVLAALWHESPRGREAGALDVGNELVIQRGLSRSTQDLCNTKTYELARVLAISDTGAANDPLMCGPVPSGLPAVMLPGGVERFAKRPQYRPRHPLPPVGALSNQPGESLG